MSFIILTSKGVAASEEEDDGPIEVQLAAEPEPEPPPPPPPPPDVAKAAPKPKLAVPTSLSDEKLEEKEPTKELQQQDEKMDEPEKAAPPVASVAPPPPKPTVVREKPAVKKPIRLTEDMAKPVMLSGSKSPEMPPDVKAKGIEGTVIVRYVIAEDGSVKDVKALKGPPELHATCIATVKAWRFQPIIVEGSPQAVVRMARFSFRIK